MYIQQGTDEPDCPDPVQCVANPCQNATCPRFLNAICEPDNCNGECRATFVNPRKGNKPIDDCDTETCADKECPTRRICMDEVFPPNCPEDQPFCRQYMRAVCELPPKPLPPSDCSVVLCGPGTVCDVLDTRNGPHARCVLFRPTTCEELEPCDEGMMCRLRERKDKDPVVRCVPIGSPPKPRDCSELECEEGFDCMLFGREGKRKRARCVKDRPPPKSCKELDCEAVGMFCRVGSGRPRCRVPRNCDELQCPGPLICMILDVPDIPRDFRCPLGVPCDRAPLHKLSDNRILGCFNPTASFQECAEVECSDDSVCFSKEFTQRDSSFSVCVPKDVIAQTAQLTTCDFVPDDFCASDEACVDLLQGNYRGFAHCTQIGCNEEPCREEEDSCVESNPTFSTRSGISHSCAPADRGMLEIETNCTHGRLNPCPATFACTDARLNTIPFGTICIPPFDLPTLRCDDLSCEDGEECVLDMSNNQIVRAFCVSSSFLDQLLASVPPL